MPYNLKEPYISKVMDISTGHITEQDNDLLGKDDCPIAAYPYGPRKDMYGYQVEILFDPKGFHDRMEACSEFGFSKDFRKICEAAHNKGCEYVRFDRDGAEYDDLTVYPW